VWRCNRALPATHPGRRGVRGAGSVSYRRRRDTWGGDRCDCPGELKPGRGLGAACNAVRAPLVVERREDARREWRRTAALDQSGQRMEVHAALARQFLRESRLEAGVTQAHTAPRDDIRRFLPDLSLLSGNKVHLYLAQRDPRLLPTARSRPRLSDSDCLGKESVGAAAKTLDSDHRGIVEFQQFCCERAGNWSRD
jgi:hypothetical protein